MAGAKIRAGDCYNRFTAWTKSSGEENHHLTLTAFGQRVESLGIRKEKSNGVWYCGIALSAEAEENPYV
jgi:hypothetical protein